jgi:O-antigen/teichoic acid export membrane protein
MNTIQMITKNVSVLFISQLLNYVLGFFILIYTARYLGVEGFGILSFALAFTGIFSVSLDLGLSTLMIREVARNKSIAKEFIPNVTAIKILLAFITLGIIYIILYILGYNEQIVQVVYLLTIYTIFSSFSQMYYSLFLANEEMEYQSLGTILGSILLLSGTLLAIYLNCSIVQLAFIYVIVATISFIYVLTLFLHKYTMPKLKFDIGTWKSYLLEAWPFAITGISINLYLYVDTIILTQYKGPDAVGLYNAAYRLVYVLFVVPMIFNNALFPVMSQYYISSKKSLKFTTQKFFKTMIFIGFPMGVFTFLFSEKIITLIYGDQFVGAVIALQILIFSCIIVFARSPFERLLESSNSQLSITKIFIIGLITNIFLNLIFIPLYSYIGAGIITVCTDLVVISLLIFVTRNFNILNSEGILFDMIKIFVASVIMGAILTFLNGFNIFILVFCGFIIYTGLILILKVINPDEAVMIRSIFRREN